MLNVLVKEPFKGSWTRENAFDKAFAVQGEVFREVKNRRTMRFELDGKNYFIKIHRPVGWSEILKNRMFFKNPVTGARNEFEAINLLNDIGVDTMTLRVFAERGNNPAKRESFIITDEVTGHTDLETFCAGWKTKPPFEKLKRSIIRELAKTCAKMHAAGLNHRDCYLCHFMLDDKKLADNGEISLLVMDLHRAEIRAKVPVRMLVKDVAGIFFSSFDAGLSKRDALFFIAEYSRILKLPLSFWTHVMTAAKRLYRKEWKREPEL